MKDSSILLNNIDKIHTTEMGVDRIKRNLRIDVTDVVAYCKNKIMDKNCNIFCMVRTGSMRVTISELLSTHIVIRLSQHIQVSKFQFDEINHESKSK